MPQPVPCVERNDAVDVGERRERFRNRAEALGDARATVAEQFTVERMPM